MGLIQKQRNVRLQTIQQYLQSQNMTKRYNMKVVWFTFLFLMCNLKRFFLFLLTDKMNPIFLSLTLS